MDGADQPEQALGIIRWFEPLFVSALYALVTTFLYCDVLEEFFNIDDSLWIGGRILGSPARLTQHYLLHRVCLPLFGDHIIGYRLLSLGLHAANALLIHYLFIAFFRRIKNSLHACGPLLRSGALMSGLLFLVHNNYAPRWISALAVQLVVFFSLSALIFALRYFRHGRPACWIAAAACYGLALISHSYALALPVFLLLIEICTRKHEDHTFHPGGMTVRYLAFAGVLGLFLWQFRADLIMAGVAALEGESALSLARHFFTYLWVVILQFLPGVPGILSGGGAFEWIAASAVVGLFILGAGEILARHRVIGFAGVTVLFFITWNGLSFFQTMAAGSHYTACWRLYFNTVGLSIVATYGILRIIDTVCRSAGRITRNVILGTVAIGLPAIMLASGGVAGHRLTVLKDLIAGNLQYRHPIWLVNEQCGDLKRLTLREPSRSPGTIKDLRCRDLRNADLSAADLAGADLSGSNLCGAHLGGASLKGAVLKDACLNWADLKGADLRDAVLDRAFLIGADLGGADLGGATAVGARFWTANLIEASLAGANLQEADMREASLNRADLSRADMAGTVLTWADLRGAVLKGVDVNSTVLDGALLPGADLGETEGLTCGRLQGAVIDGKTKLPDGLDCGIEPTGAPGLSRVLP